MERYIPHTPEGALVATSIIFVLLWMFQSVLVLLGLDFGLAVYAWMLLVLIGLVMTFFTLAPGLVEGERSAMQPNQSN